MVTRTQKYSDDETPRWSYWKQLKKITLEEAILLSLGINPDLTPHKLESIQSFWDIEISERTEISYSWARDADWSVWPIQDIPSFDMVDLVKFIRWCNEDRKWKSLPPEFLEISQIGSEKDVEDFLQKPKSRRQENNDLRLIGALRKMLETNDIYLTNTQLIDDLCEIYKGKEPFKKSTLEGKFAEAKRMLESD